MTGCSRRSFLGVGAGAAGLSRASDVRRLQVGPLRRLRTLAEAAAACQPGDSIEVDAGVYPGDVAVWTHDNVSLRAAGGRVLLKAEGQAAERKAIWVVRAQGMRVDGFDFEGCRVPGRNGAGIRFERGSLFVADCRFFDNEMGLLTGNDPHSVLEVQACEFARNWRDDGGHNHNLYVGSIARLRCEGNYSHDARVGHLLKSRAARNEIICNRLTDETGHGSYELEFPNGGFALVVGNLLQQSLRTENPTMLSYGAEGPRWSDNRLVMVNNTFVDDLLEGGVFYRTHARPELSISLNNAWVGNGRLASPDEAEGNVMLSRSDLDARFRLRRPLPQAVATPWAPWREFREPRGSVVLPDSTGPYVGAFAPSR